MQRKETVKTKAEINKVEYFLKENITKSRFFENSIKLINQTQESREDISHPYQSIVIVILLT